MAPTDKQSRLCCVKLSRFTRRAKVNNISRRPGLLEHREGLAASAAPSFVPSLRVRDYRERWTPFKGEGDWGCSKNYVKKQRF